MLGHAEMEFDSSSPSADDYLIRLRRIIQLKPTFYKNPTVGKSAQADSIGLKLQPQRKKSRLTNKSVFDNGILIISAHCKFPYVGLQPNPVHNSLFSLIQLSKSEFLSNGIHQKPSTPCPETQNHKGHFEKREFRTKCLKREDDKRKRHRKIEDYTSLIKG